MWFISIYGANPSKRWSCYPCYSLKLVLDMVVISNFYLNASYKQSMYVFNDLQNIMARIKHFIKFPKGNISPKNYIKEGNLNSHKS